MSCRSPTEKFAPNSETGADRPNCASSSPASDAACSRARRSASRSSSVCSSPSLPSAAPTAAAAAAAAALAFAAPSVGDLAAPCASALVACATTLLRRPTLSSASHTSASLYCLNGSRLSRTVPENSTGSCGMMARLRRSVVRPRFAQSWPSSETEPLSTSTIRYSVSSNELLPLPVRPTTPTFSPACTVNDTDLSTRGVPSR
mmetsp:Transcript_11549/g.40386  ORF Transcript_11549/g.40386 Transcript_11549/m.40386 type:complete len:203 (+) Transcript_11549:612-1220(+)